MKYILFTAALSLLTIAMPAYGRDYYIDSVQGSDENSGTSPTTAWMSLDKVNDTIFQPGDVLHFKRSCVWFGQLKPGGSGTADAPITITDYGAGHRAIINGNGVVGEAVVYLHNQQYWEINDLEITNPAEEEGDRRGVWLSGSNCGTLNHLYLNNLYIHDIYGIAGQSLEAKRTGGVYIAITDDSLVPSRWDDLRIENCVVHDVRNTGISTQNETTKDIHDFTTDSQEWFQRRITNLYVANNTIYNVAKNGIIIRLADGGLVEHNLLHDTAIGPDGKGMTGNTIFSRSARNTVFQFNEGYNNRSDNYDGSLYDADLNSPGTVWQYSYSHDNAHGLYWGCTVEEDAGIIVRYNISQNDKGGIFVVNYPTQSTYIYNNTVYIGSHRSPVILYERGNGAGDFRYYEFKNNLIYCESDSATYQFNTKPEEGYNRVISHNLFYGVSPPDYSTLHRTDDPLLQDPGSGGTGIDFRNPDKLQGYRLIEGSPAIDSGTTIPRDGGLDFWGSRLDDGKTDIGAHEYAASGPMAVDVYILSGQSNMSGRVNTGFTASPEVDGDILYYFRTDGPPKNDVSSGGEFSSLQVLDSGFYGAEISMARSLHAGTHNKLAIIKISDGGTSLAVDWNSRAGIDNVWWQHWISDTSDAVADLKAMGYSPVLKGIAWLQGESDQGESRSILYEENFRNLVDDMLEHLGGLMKVDGARFVTALIKRVGDGADLVRSAQVAVMDSTADGQYFDTMDLSFLADNAHFDEVSVRTIGERFAEKFLIGSEVPESTR